MSLTALASFFRPPREPIEVALANGDALVLYEELDGLEHIDTGPVIHPLSYLGRRSYLPVLTTLAPHELARLARHDAFLECLDDTAVVRALIPASEAQRRIELDPDERYMLSTGEDAVGQYLYRAERAIVHAEQEVARVQSDTGRLFPPSERRAWRVDGAKRRRDLLRAVAAAPDRARMMGITLVPVVPESGPCSEAGRAMAPLYARLREAVARRDKSVHASAELQSALEALCVFGARTFGRPSEARDGNLG